MTAPPHPLPSSPDLLQSSRDVEVTATHIDYVDAPLAMVLRSLDWVLYLVETWLRGLWLWLRRQW